ncbi:MULTISPECIES: hypothetical protein [unclassified Spiroplasma]|uniref:hypothetical protein n=1 Tax=unclassified Spiroplasma TaxID=2637901 RepID=UPI0030CE83F2
MKNILTILGVITLGCIITSNVIACEKPNLDKEKYKINEQGEIIYNFQEKQSYIIGFTIDSHIHESNIFISDIPLKTTIYGQGTQYWTYININQNKAWTTGWYTNNLIYLKKGVI